MPVAQIQTSLASNSDHAVGQSRYGRLAVQLRRQITEGEWSPGSAIPAETTLAREYGVALGTMRHAIAVLVTEGLLERVHGRGTYVSSGIGGASLMRFFRFRVHATDGIDGDAISSSDQEIPASRIVSRRVVVADVATAMALGLPPRSQVLALTRIRSLRDQPCLHERLWLPLPTFSALASLEKSHWDDLLYPMYQRVCGVVVQRAEDEVTFTEASADVARALKLIPGAPCARVSRRAFDRSGRCVEVRESSGDARNFHYTVQLR
jgi:GntR family transcriptional regulator